VCLEALNRSFTKQQANKELKMLDTLDKTTTELPLDNSTTVKRALIESELRKDGSRSDREIARVVGCDHKTVGAARERLGIASPLGNSLPLTPTEHRQMLINAGEAFDAKYPNETPEQVVDRMIAEGKLSYATAGAGGGDPPLVPKEPEFDPFESGAAEMVIPHQPAIAVYENPFGAVVIRQERLAGDDDDPVIIVRPEHVEKLIARLRLVAKEALK
jgi:hypothetical protein